MLRWSRLSLAAIVLAVGLQAGRLLLGPDRGLQAEYFVGLQTAGVPAIRAIDGEISTAQIGARWAGAAPTEFGARWFGFLSVARSGRYTFSTTSDDGSLFSIDGRPLIDNGGTHGPQTRSATVALEAGAHPMLMEFTETGGGFVLEWQWGREGARLDAVPGWALTPFKVAPGRVFVARGLDVASIALLGLAAAAGVWRVWIVRWTPSRHPRAAAFALFVLLAVVHTWPLASAPGRLARHDNRDTILNEWIVAWVAHQITTAPLQLFNANIFHPETDTLAYSEAMLVQSAMGAPILWLGGSPVLAYNLVLLAGFALSGWSMCLVIRRWTGDWTAGLVSGCIFAFSAHALTRIPHLQAQHVEFLPMALLALDAMLRRPTAGAAAKLAMWCVLQALTSVYLMAITLFAMMAAVLARPEEWWGHRAVSFARAAAIAALLAALVLVPFLLPYYRVSDTQGLVRSLDDAASFSASWRDYLITPSRVHSLVWTPGVSEGTALFPGAIGLALTLLALLRGGALKDPRARMCLAMGLAGIYVSFGPIMPGYAALYSAVPILHGIRATARFGYMATVAVAAVAGFGVVTLRSLVPARRWPAVAIVLVACAALEPLAAPLGLSRFDGISPIYAHVPRAPGVVVVEMPFHGPSSAQFHAHYMLNSTAHWQPIVNGYSGFQPASFYAHAEALQRFPDDGSIARLREIGVSHVFVHRSQFAHERLNALKMRRELELVEGFGETELYRLTR